MSRSKRASPALIGAFVLGAIALTITGITIFASGKFFRQTQQFVAVFSGSVNGLSVGAPVKFRGVEVGSVSKILLSLPKMTLPELRIPVFISIDRETTQSLGAMVDPSHPDTLNGLIERGLRAQLQLESIVTGVLFVELDLFPQSTPNFYLPADSGYIEIPTQPTLFQEATQTATDLVGKLRDIDFEGLVGSIRDAARGVSDLTGSPEIRQALLAMRETLATARDTLNDVKPRIGPLVGRVEGGFDDLELTLKRLDQTLASVQTTVAAFDRLLDPRAPLVYQATTTLAELSDAARSVRQFADYLDRNPNALITGRPNP